MTTREPRTAAPREGTALRELFAAATAWFERHVDAVNAINVFPVPDGDTGTNMHLTLRAALAEAERCDSGRAGDVAAALARGALLGARGNSGVILSQFIRGFATGVRDQDRVNPNALAAALQEAADAAYRTVPNPVEGTILTVARRAAGAAVGASAERPADILIAAVDAANAAVADTPRLLPVLAEAGVVDAGGQGLAILLEGALRYLRGETTIGESLGLPEAGAIRSDWRPSVDAAHGAASTFGYCTEFLLVSASADRDSVRAQLEALGDSVIVVRDDDLLRAHVHTDEPGAALTLATSLGRLRSVKVDDMQAQYVAASRGRASATPPPAVAIVAVAAGDGLSGVLRSVGATAIVAGGQTMNPSAQDILDAARACGSAQVIVLPNNKNIEMAARQAAELGGIGMHVVPTTSVPQGITALLAFDAERPAPENAERMAAAAVAVRTIEVTRAVRDARADGVATHTGDAIALIDDVLRAAGASLEDVAIEAMGMADAAGCSLATIYYGCDADEAAARALADRLAERFAGLEVEIVDGGQPHYPFILSLE